MKNFILISGLLAIIMCGCSKDEVGNEIIDNLVKFNVKYPVTKATGNSFEIGDAIGVYMAEYDNGKVLPLQMAGNYANNIRSTFDGTKWVNSPAIYWKDGVFDVYAYYPYSTPQSIDEYSFAVSLDQSTEESNGVLNGYEASDFLWAKTASVSKMDAVPLTFKHKMSKLTIKLVKGENFSGDIPSGMVVKIHNTVTDALIDLSSGTVTKNPYSSAKTITAKKVSDTEYTAIVVPQRINSKLPLLEIIYKNVSYLIESKFIFKTGVAHTINVTLDNSPDKIRIEIGGEKIEGWE